MDIATILHLATFGVPRLILRYILASDEVGYGALAGNLTVTAVMAPEGFASQYLVRDSKKMSEVQRERAYGHLIQEPNVYYSTVVIEPKVIDQMNVWQALISAHETAQRGAWVNGGSPTDVIRYVDGKVPVENAIQMPKCDDLIWACSAASVIAKVTRDRAMNLLAMKHKGYDFENSKGYGTPKHMKALEKLGVTPAHRRSYKPVSQALEAELETDWTEFMD